MNARQRMWSPDEIDLVLWCYEDTPTQELADLMDRPLASVYKLAKTLELRKSPELLSRMGAEKLLDENRRPKNCYPKGHVPANKGIKRPGYAPGRMAATQFKKGQTNHNFMPIGSTRWIGSGTGGQERYLYRKVSAKRYVPYTVNWKAEHVLIWEKKHGKVPRGHNVVFKDGNRENIKLRNLELVSRAEWMRRHQMHDLPEELKEVIRLKGSIKRHITWRRKHAEKQDVGPTQPPVRNTRGVERQR